MGAIFLEGGWSRHVRPTRHSPLWGDCVEKLAEFLLPVIFEFAALVWQNNDAMEAEKAIYFYYKVEFKYSSTSFSTQSGTKSGSCRRGRAPALGSVRRPSPGHAAPSKMRRVEMWRGVGRSNISVAAPFVWRCLTGSAVAPFPHPAHRTGQAELPHPALGQDVTPSPTTGRDQAGSGVRARSARKGARVDKLRPCVARPYA